MMVDITQQVTQPIYVDFRTRLLIQRNMIAIHGHFVGERLQRKPSSNEIIESWIEQGFAARFALHYRLENERPKTYGDRSQARSRRSCDAVSA